MRAKKSYPGAGKEMIAQHRNKTCSDIINSLDHDTRKPFGLDELTRQNSPLRSDKNRIGKILPFAVIFLPISLICIFSFSILYYGTPEFRVDKTQHGLKIGKIHEPLNPVQTGDLIIRVNTLTYDQILVYLISPDRAPWKSGYHHRQTGRDLY